VEEPRHVSWRLWVPGRKCVASAQFGGLRTPPVFRETGKSAAEIFVSLSAVYGDESLFKMSAV